MGSDSKEKGCGMRRFAVLLWLLMPAGLFAGNGHDFPLAADLKLDAEASARKHAPIMVFYMSDNCAYCTEVNDLYLRPMQKSGVYKGRLILRTVNIGSVTSLRGFNGELVEHERFAESQGVNFTPVIKIYDHRGRELVPEIAGYTTPDFYGAYLEAAIDQSITRLRKPN